MQPPELSAAERFLAGHARVLDRRRFERLFRGGEAQPVRDAVAAYRNPDGGFGHALEPDGRTPVSQPAALMLALRTLDEADAWDEALVTGALEWLERTAPGEGGAVSFAPGVEAGPHAPWWRPEPAPSASLITTGPIAAVLRRRGVSHPWLQRAEDLLWARIEALETAGPYDLLGVFAFLDAAPDRERARAALQRVGPRLLEDVVTLDPEAPGEVHGPLGFAPLPGSIGRTLFDDATIAAHLDHLAAAQADDGGWTFNWPAWSPVAAAEWRGSLTVDMLALLRANGRTPGDRP